MVLEDGDESHGISTRKKKQLQEIQDNPIHLLVIPSKDRRLDTENSRRKGIAGK